MDEREVRFRNLENSVCEIFVFFSPVMNFAEINRCLLLLRKTTPAAATMPESGFSSITLYHSHNYLEGTHCHHPHFTDEKAEA